MDLAKMIMGARAMLREKNLPSIDHSLGAYNSEIYDLKRLSLIHLRPRGRRLVDNVI